MAQEKPNPVGHAMKWGLLIGACFAVNFILSATGITVLSLLTYLVEIFILIATWRIAKNYRDEELGGEITFGKAWSYLFMLFFFASLIGGIVKWVYLQWIRPDYLDTMFSQAMLLLEQLNVELPDDTAEQFQRMLTPIRYTMQMITSDTLLGALLGLIYAPFLKRKNNHDGEEADIA